MTVLKGVSGDFQLPYLGDLAENVSSISNNGRGV